MAQVDVTLEGGSSEPTPVRCYFIVTGNANGGSGGGSTSGYSECVPGDIRALNLSKLPIPSRSGYGFRGWSTSSTGGVAYGSSGVYSFTVKAGQNTYSATLYAVWTQYSTLKYSANTTATVSNIPEDVTKYKGSTNTLSSTVPVRTNWVFKGWNTKADGTGTTYQPGASVTFNTGGTWYLYAVWKEVGTLTADNATMGVQHSVTITNSTSGLTFTVAYNVAGQSGWISGPTASSNKNLTWTPSTDLAQYITNAASASMTLTLSTYNGSSLVGTYTKTISLSVPSSMVPTISSATMTESATMPSEFLGLWVKEVSKPQFTISAAGVSGSTISSYTVTIGDDTYTSTTSPVIVDPLNSYGQLTATIVAIDTRGKTATYTISFMAYDHYLPSITFGEVDRVEGSPENIKVNYSYVVAPVNNLNHKTVKIAYKEVGASSYTSVPDITPSYYSGYSSYTITSTNIGTEYDIRIQIVDSAGQSSEYYIEVPRFGGFYFDVNPDDDTIAYHGEAPGDGADHYFEKILGLEQGHSAKSISSSGTSYVRIAKLVSKVTRSNNIATKYTISTFNDTINANSSEYLGPLLENLAPGTYTVSWKYKIESIPEGAEAFYSGSSIGYYDSNNQLHSPYSWRKDSDTYNEYHIGDEVIREHSFTLTQEQINEAVSFYINMNGYGNRYGPILYFGVSVSDFQLEAGSVRTDFKPYVDMNNRNMTAPIFLRYMNSDLNSVVKLTIQFDGAMNNTKFYIAFVQMGEADLVQVSDEQWDLYVKKKSSSDVIDVLDVINPPRNSDLLIDWDNTVLSSLPTGYIQATNDPYEIGYQIYVDASVVSVPNNSWKTVATINLPSRGTWLVYNSAQFDTNTTGRRVMIFTKTQNSDGGNLSVQFKDTRAPVNGAVTICKSIDVRKISDPETVYLNVYQNSGGALNCYGRIYAIRLN